MARIIRHLFVVRAYTPEATSAGHGSTSMTRFLLAAAVVIAAIAGPFMLTLTTRAQGVVRFEYTYVTTHQRLYTGQGVPGGVLSTAGYRACLAAGGQWTCRDFDRADLSDASLTGAWATALTTLGNEGWELVSVVYDPQASLNPTHIFKRQRP
jgi:hypothetical protein